MIDSSQHLNWTRQRKGRFVVNKPIITVDQENLEKGGISSRELGKYLPRYILNPTPLYYGWIKRVWFSVVQWFLSALVKIFLRPRQTLVGNLDTSEVDGVYTSEAAVYNRKHHLATRGMDLIWRRMAGWFVTTIARNGTDHLKILDLCTGTGLVIKEMISVLAEWNMDTDEITGLDYNAEMLSRAKNSISVNDKVRFARGDAMNLVKNGQSENRMTTFAPNSIDAITQILGIGGIPEPLKVFDGVLRILKPGVQFFMIDMHKPIPEQPGEWTFLLRWCHFPTFEMVVYEQTTIPLVLRRLWGWRDATASFYLLPLVTYQDSEGRYWSFKVQNFEQESQRWWFALPLMPIGKIVVGKVEISEKVAKTRKTILEACNSLQQT